MTEELEIRGQPRRTDSQPVAAPEAARTSRGALLGRTATLGGLVVAGGTLAAGLPAVAGSAPSPAVDRRILSFLLRLEYLQEAFYAEARDEGKLKGELRQFAEVAGADERAHIALLRKALGRRAPARPTYDFGRATTDARTFRSKAVMLEELVTSAYIGQGPNLSRRLVTRAGRIASVEARHAAWISDIAGRHPAPRAADHGVSEQRVRRTLRQLGFVERS